MIEAGHFRPRKKMKMKTMKVIEKHGLDFWVAVDALTSFYGEQFICEQFCRATDAVGKVESQVIYEKLCEMVDKAANVDRFVEFMDNTFSRSTRPVEVAVSNDPREPTQPEPTATDDKISSDEEFLCQLAEMEGGPVEAACSATALDPLTKAPREPVPIAKVEDRRFPEYVPDKWDMEMLAWAYLDEGIALEMHSFTTGYSEKSWDRFQRFELIAKHLGESKRREIIDAMDAHQARHQGDDWQVFKASCKPGFWSTPADRAAVLRVADSLPEHMSDTEADRCGHEYLEILRGAQKERATNFTSGSTNPEGVVPDDSNWEPAK
jgi:hypothetical protein